MRTRYTIASSNSVEELLAAVEVAISDGWQPLGGVSHSAVMVGLKDAVPSALLVKGAHSMPSPVVAYRYVQALVKQGADVREEPGLEAEAPS